jgi:uncharacterized membrane protein required for colicin V production
MTWFPPFALVLTIVMIYVGTKRGLIMELFDLLWLAGAFAAASYAKGPMAKFCMQRFHWDASYAHNFNFIVVFILTTIVIFFIGVLLNDTLKMYIPDILHTFLGGLIGAFKSVTFLYIFVVLLSLFPMNNDARATLHKDFLLQKVQDLTPSFSGIIYTLAPESAAKYYLKQIKNHKL